ncbi:MAG TPA: peptidylprolyl isomerase [Fibrobacteria bacterium]|jgi:peptidylprolyl isomerase|nr:peptidylprolyl isomerase [Fibrobacteria bacterium]
MKNFVLPLLALCLTPVLAAAQTPQGPMGPGIYANVYTSKGLIVGELEYQKVPLTVINFVGLAEGTKNHNREGVKRFYDGLTFHRVIPNFMIQGGDPQGNGMGGPGYQFDDEFVPSLKHSGPGVFSMANSGPATNGSQFFITHVATPWLNGKHTIFGHVVEGQNVVNAIQQGDKIDSIRILRVGAAAKAFKADEAAFQAQLKSRADAAAAKEKAAQAELKDLEKGSKQTASGLRYIVRKEGIGPKPARGTRVKAHYTGRLVDGTKFDSSRDRGAPFEFDVGVGQVIPGWDEAFLDMRKGEQRTLIIPPHLGYGDAGAGGVIPPGATLVFDVELVDF